MRITYDLTARDYADATDRLRGSMRGIPECAETQRLQPIGSRAGPRAPARLGTVGSIESAEQGESSAHWYPIELGAITGEGGAVRGEPSITDAVAVGDRELDDWLDRTVGLVAFKDHLV